MVLTPGGHYTYSDLQTITDHKRLDSVKRYGKTELTKKKSLMEKKKVISGKFGEEIKNVTS